MASTDDPIVRSSRREALFAMSVWLAAMIYTVSVCVRYGYLRPAEQIRYLWGFPDWILWGLMLPWIVCTLVTIWFAWFFMASDSLGEDTDFLAGDDELPEGEKHR